MVRDLLQAMAWVRGRAGLQPSLLGQMALDTQQGNATIKRSHELSGDRLMGIWLGSKIHLFYNCPDVFIDPRI